MKETRLIAALRILSSRLAVYHGSDKSIDRLKSGIKTKRHLFFKSFDVFTRGVFFALTPSEAKEYGKNVYKVSLENPNLFIKMEDRNVGVDRLDGKREKHLAEMLMSAAENSKIVLFEKDIHIPENFNPDGPLGGDDWLWVYDAVGQGLMWDLLDDPNFVEKMKDLGYDGTVVDEPDMKSKKSIFICNLEKISDFQLIGDGDF